MALNTTVYFPNPAGTESKTVGETTSAGGSTIYTTPGGKNVRVRGFTISIHVISGGAATNDYVAYTLKIGTGRYTISIPGRNLPAAGDTAYIAVGGDDIGFEASFLQPADTITSTITSDLSSGMTYIASSAVYLEDFTA